MCVCRAMSRSSFMCEYSCSCSLSFCSRSRVESSQWHSTVFISAETAWSLSGQAVFVQDREIEGIWCPDIWTAAKPMNDLWLIHWFTLLSKRLSGAADNLKMLQYRSGLLVFGLLQKTAWQCGCGEFWMEVKCVLSAVSAHSCESVRSADGQIQQGGPHLDSSSGPAGSGSDWTWGLQCFAFF